MFYVAFHAVKSYCKELWHPFLSRYAVDIFSVLQVQFQQYFSEFDPSAKEISVLQNPLNWVIGGT